MRFMIALCFVLLTPIAAKADPVQDVISGQLEALQADDFAKAFTYASPTIKRLFGSPERFGQMVRNGYPMVWRPAEVEFTGQEVRGPFIYQTLRIRDAQGVFHHLEYQMIQTENGWQINGVQFIEAPELAA